MKLKRLITALLILFASFTTFADIIPIDVKGGKKSTDEPQPENGRQRAPMRLPIDVWLDTEALTVTIDCYGEIDGAAYLYDSRGNIVDAAPSLDAVLSLPSAGSYTLYLAGDSWEATADINL